MERGVIQDSLVTRNGGAICGTGGIVIVGGRLIASTVTSNSNGNCGRAAGGVYAIDAEVVNSTISGNHAENAAAGVTAEGGTIVNSTITGNSTEFAWDPGRFSGTGGLSGNGVTIRNTIVAGNSGTQAYTQIAAPDCDGSIISGGHNLVGDLTGCSFAAMPSDLTDVDALLGPLGEYGGPMAGPDGNQEAMLTHRLLPYAGKGSPALDAWYDGSVGSGASCPRYDQRGVHRPQDGNGDGIAKCDIGALEWMR
jgi:hypothetical protein